MAIDHSHATGSYGRAFAIGAGLNLLFVIVEAAYGIKSHSLALVADAGRRTPDASMIFES